MAPTKPVSQPSLAVLLSVLTCQKRVKPQEAVKLLHAVKPQAKHWGLCSPAAVVCPQEGRWLQARSLQKMGQSGGCPNSNSPGMLASPVAAVTHILMRCSEHVSLGGCKSSIAVYLVLRIDPGATCNRRPCRQPCKSLLLRACHDT